MSQPPYPPLPPGPSGGRQPPSYPFGPPGVPGPPWPPGAPQPGYPPQPPRGTNGFAIASLIFGLLGGVLLAVIFGIVALRQIPRRGQQGRGMAIAGIVLSGVWVAVIGLVVTAVLLTDADRDESGDITAGGSVSATSLQVGDCINGLHESDNVSSLPAVPCGEPHEGEVFALFDLQDAGYPGGPAVIRQAEDGCTRRLASYAPGAAADPSIELFYLYPTDTTWPQGDREVVCIASDPSGPRTGSLRGR